MQMYGIFSLHFQNVLKHLNIISFNVIMFYRDISIQTVYECVNLNDLRCFRQAERGLYTEVKRDLNGEIVDHFESPSFSNLTEHTCICEKLRALDLVGVSFPLAKKTIFNDILHMSFLAGTHVFKAYPAYTTTAIRVRTKYTSICSVSVELYL